MNRARLTPFPNYENPSVSLGVRLTAKSWTISTSGVPCLLAWLLLQTHRTFILQPNIFLGEHVWIYRPACSDTANTIRYFIKTCANCSETLLCLSHGPPQICHQNVLLLWSWISQQILYPMTLRTMSIFLYTDSPPRIVESIDDIIWLWLVWSLFDCIWNHHP